MERKNRIPNSALQLIVLWLIYATAFAVLGGIGAGVTALLWTLVMTDPFSDLLYAVLFAGYGVIGYRLVQRWIESVWLK